MKRLFLVCPLVVLAACIAGCGKDPAAETAAPAATDRGPDFDTLMRTAVAGVAQKDAAAATASAAKALELQPESAEAHLLAGQAACLRQDYDEARAQFSSVVKAKTLPNVLRAKAYVGLGTVDYVQHEADAARISFLQARRLDNSNEAAWYYLGMIYRDIFHFEEAAQEHFQMFVGLSSKSDNPLTKKVKEEILPELYSNAAARAKARTGNAGKAAALIQEAQTQRDKNRLTEAVKKYAEARKADPQSDVAALGYAQLVTSTDKTAEGARKAIQAYHDVIALKPGGLDYYLKAAQLARAFDFKIQAVEIMNRAIAHHPQNPKVLDQLIAALLKTGNDKLAKAWGEYRKDLGGR
ncbi:MAG: hypothetical protein IJJ84_09455 [Kiritimatiellae bacterium]|nr:hypothetical protein [Kiritimatiellia bacterium]